MVLPITQYGDAVLRQKCEPITEVTPEIRAFAEDMIETMVDAHGVGLAAPQVDKAIRLAVVDTSHDPECISYLRVNGEDREMSDIMPLVFINPELELLGAKEVDVEGCLSIQEITAKVNRRSEVKATLPQLDGSTLVVETDGLLARAIQHEVDHLDGVLFTDRLSAAAKVSVKRKLTRLKANR